MPTFGNLSAGTVTADFSTPEAYGYAIATPADCTSLDDIQCSLVQDVANKQFKGLVSDTSGNLLANGIGSASGLIGAKAWYTSTFAIKPAVAASTTYWFWCLPSGWTYLYADAGDVLWRHDVANNYAAPTDPGMGSSWLVLGVPSIKVDYTVAAGGNPNGGNLHTLPIILGFTIDDVMRFLKGKKLGWYNLDKIEPMRFYRGWSQEVLNA